MKHAKKKIKKSVCATSFAKSECEISRFEMFVPSILSSWEQKPEKSILNIF